MIVGGSNHFIRGINIRPNDIDLVCDIETARSFLQRLGLPPTELAYTESNTIISHYAKLIVADFPVEIMCHARTLGVSGEWRGFPDVDGSIDIFQVGGVSVHLAKIECEIVVYKHLGRHDRVALLESLLS